MLLTTHNIANVVGAEGFEKAFIEWSFRQSEVDNEYCTVKDGKRSFIGDVTYTLLSDGRIRGRCPEMGLFIAAKLNKD